MLSFVGEFSTTGASCLYSVTLISDATTFKIAPDVIEFPDEMSNIPSHL